MTDNPRDKKTMLELAKEARLAISYQAPFQQDSALADWFTTAYKMGERKGRADCLQETVDLKKSLLPHELKLIAQLLDYTCGEFSVNDIPDTFELADTKRHADLKIDIASWLKAGPEADRSKDWDRDLMSYMAHRVREALAQEEG